MNDVYWRCRGKETDDSAITEKSQVAVVCDDEDGRSAPGGLICGGLTAAHIVDRADVASVETDPWAVSEHVLPRRINVWIVERQGKG